MKQGPLSECKRRFDEEGEKWAGIGKGEDRLFSSLAGLCLGAERCVDKCGSVEY